MEATVALIASSAAVPLRRCSAEGLCFGIYAPGQLRDHHRPGHPRLRRNNSNRAEEGGFVHASQLFATSAVRNEAFESIAFGPPPHLARLQLDGDLARRRPWRGRARMLCATWVGRLSVPGSPRGCQCRVGVHACFRGSFSGVCSRKNEG